MKFAGVILLTALVAVVFIDSLPVWVVAATAAFLWAVVGVWVVAERRQ